ncbi:phosphatase PAP2 family protein [Algoriphagus sediminis]|uniref:PA-phosphatase n=1 Tax=Algoriphagus sediminis TaxID=3057113 RepID=A0ABT7Y978_9BACT|nr:phosphatase PAP2 family protein [Algoriphagus sediminis]MDN3203021.1 PA-phosphatase [Algoriphagus sediminis]
MVFALIFYSVPEASSIPVEFKDRLYSLIVLSTLLIPLITIIGFRLSGVVKSLHMATMAERYIPFTIICIYFGLTTYFLYDKTEFDPVIWRSLFVITLTIIGLTIVTFFWKMSAHMTGVGGLMAIIIVMASFFPNFQELYYLLGAILLAGIVGTSRLYLNAHRPQEIYAGLVYGFLCCYLGFQFVWT